MLYIYTMSTISGDLDYATLDFTSLDYSDPVPDPKNYGSNNFVTQMVSHTWRFDTLDLIDKYRYILSIISKFGLDVTINDTDILGDNSNTYSLNTIIHKHKIIFRSSKDRRPQQIWMNTKGEDDFRLFFFEDLNDRLEYYGDFGTPIKIYFKINNTIFKITLNYSNQNQEEDIAILEAFIIWLWRNDISADTLKKAINYDPKSEESTARGSRKRDSEVASQAMYFHRRNLSQPPKSEQSVYDRFSNWYYGQAGAKKNKKKYKKTSHKKNTRNKNNTRNKKKYNKKNTQKKRMKKNLKKKK